MKRHQEWRLCSATTAAVAQPPAFHRDPDYAPFVALRQRGSDLEMVLVEGLSENTGPEQRGCECAWTRTDSCGERKEESEW